MIRWADVRYRVIHARRIRKVRREWRAWGARNIERMNAKQKDLFS